MLDLIKQFCSHSGILPKFSLNIVPNHFIKTANLITVNVSRLFSLHLNDLLQLLEIFFKSAYSLFGNCTDGLWFFAFEYLLNGKKLLIIVASEILAIILHNVVYAVFELEEGIFFILAVFISYDILHYLLKYNILRSRDKS